MKMKAGVVVVIGVMLLGTSTITGINAPFLESAKEEQGEETALSMEFSPPKITEYDKYVIINSGDDTMCLMNEGVPLLPYNTKVMTFPLGTTIESIEVTTSDVNVMQLDKKIKPAPKPIPANIKSTQVEIKEGEIYSSSELYPSEWITYNIGVGIQNEEHIIFLSIYFFPARYVPSANEIHYVDEITVEVTYGVSHEVQLANDEYDLLIICPRAWEEDMQQLVQHKDSHGIKTKLVCLECIYGGEYFSSEGRDDAEKVKYFIKNAVEEWGIKYVLLVGGRHGGFLEEKWWCPVRYSHLDDNSDWETSYLCDLYFADIYEYKDGELAFEDWDSNDNGVFAEWNALRKDNLDLYPDVYVGRLACRNKIEVKTMIDKIVAYETTPFGEFNRFITVAGDSYNDSHGYIEGELAASEANQYMQGFEKVKIWSSLIDLNAENIGGAINSGASFAYFVGHGNPMSWTTHEPGTFAWEEGFQIFDMPMLKNGYKLPVVVIGGCHNSQFNVSLYNSLYRERVWKGENAPECWSWWLTRKSGGGAIATIGNTALGYHGDEDSNGDGIADYVQILDGWLEINFFRFYSEGIAMLGMLHSQTLTGYINTFPGNEQTPLSDVYDTKMVQQWCLLGDPSLKLGGYS